MSSFLLIIICFGLGVWAKKWKRFSQHSVPVINAFVLHLSLPAMVFLLLPKLMLDGDQSGRWWIPVSAMWVLFFSSWLVIDIVGRVLNWDRRTTGALILTVGLANTSFVGFPLLEAIIGVHAIPYAILADQPGSFLLLSSFGVLVALIYSGTNESENFALGITKRILLFPAFQAMLGSVVWVLIARQWHEGDQLKRSFLDPALERIGGTLSPLTLFAVGLQLKMDLKLFAKNQGALLFGIFAKLILFPLLIALIYLGVFGLTGLDVQVSLLESAMATMITAAVIAGEFGLDADIANFMVSATIPLSLVTVPVLSSFLR